MLIMPDNKINYLPFKFGGFALFENDKSYDSKIYTDYKYRNWLDSPLSSSLPENPKSEAGILYDLYNPFYIHQFDRKWKNGFGISIYRHLIKYFILLTGISDEICNIKPGYCI